MGRVTGQYEVSTVGGVGGEAVRAFVPAPLPPVEPPLALAGLADRLAWAEAALARLELTGALVPSLDWFIYAFVRKEAVLSSQIEGTQATLVDLLTWESGSGAQPAGALPNADIEEVCNYIDALRFARGQLADPKGLPLSMRLLSETHRILMRGVRGETKLPGEIRRSQNWIGGSRPGNAMYVPPPPHRLAEVLTDFERFLHAPSTLPPLIRAGLLHVQFETIHPYLDGNGRLGRLLVTLVLEQWGLLTRPLLYLSLFFKRHQPEYYRRLNAVRVDGDWEGWLDFFLDGVRTIADEAVATVQALSAQVVADRERLLAWPDVTPAAARLFEHLPGHPIVTAAWVAEALATTRPTAGKALSVLEAAGILAEATGRKRDRVYVYKAYVDRLRVGTELDGER